MKLPIAPLSCTRSLWPRYEVTPVLLQCSSPSQRQGCCSRWLWLSWQRAAAWEGHLFAHKSAIYRSEKKAWAGGFFLGLSPWLANGHLPFVTLLALPTVTVCVHLLYQRFSKRRQSYLIRTDLNELILSNCLLKDLFFKYRHILRCWGWG